jgi:hypothetical protein
VRDGKRQSSDPMECSSPPKRRVKCVSFALHEEPLCEFAEGKPGGFSPYVKRLIAADYLAHDGTGGSRNLSPLLAVLSQLVQSLAWEQGAHPSACAAVRRLLSGPPSQAGGTALLNLIAQSSQEQRRRDGQMEIEREVEEYLRRVLEASEGDLPSAGLLSPEGRAELIRRLAEDPELALQYEAKELAAIGRTLEGLARQLGAVATEHGASTAVQGFTATLADLGGMITMMGKVVGRAGTPRNGTAAADATPVSYPATRVEEGLLTRTLEERVAWFARLRAEDHLMALSSPHSVTHLLMTLRFGTDVAIAALTQLEGEEGFWAAAGVPAAELRALLEQVRERSDPLAHHVQRLLGGAGQADRNPE